jgi:formate dehydrogenase assembly factor FdhD
VRLAQDAGVCLVGFVTPKRFVAYTAADLIGV